MCDRNFFDNFSMVIPCFVILLDTGAGKRLDRSAVFKRMRNRLGDFRELGSIVCIPKFLVTAVGKMSLDDFFGIPKALSNKGTTSCTKAVTSHFVF
ncbi:hypothetical protein AYM40_11095 [Paraburkholderia phytofirmans OLGA172]|uniref:Uncharacterized protein n=1 Tax=Paraburkholderia phytofirmans OLGA172 TaxID=1417228 RepID=A0A160FKQ3_9BURK|nr:hypothetical protein AYM40_11095 [Paraburkholderia phytofirmans OLGA172]